MGRPGAMGSVDQYLVVDMLNRWCDHQLGPNGIHRHLHCQLLVESRLRHSDPWDNPLAVRDS